MVGSDGPRRLSPLRPDMALAWKLPLRVASVPLRGVAEQVASPSRPESRRRRCGVAATALLSLTFHAPWRISCHLRPSQAISCHCCQPSVEAPFFQVFPRLNLTHITQRREASKFRTPPSKKVLSAVYTSPERTSRTLRDGATV